MVRVMTQRDHFPASISEAIIQTDSHSGATTIAPGGSLTITGQVQGTIINYGTLVIKGRLLGNCINYGTYHLIGSHQGKSLQLKSGSRSVIHGQGRIDVSAETGADLVVSPGAALSASSDNQHEAIVNAGAISIGGGNVAHSLRSTGSVIFTGSSLFK